MKVRVGVIVQEVGCTKNIKYHYVIGRAKTAYQLNTAMLAVATIFILSTHHQNPVLSSPLRPVKVKWVPKHAI